MRFMFRKRRKRKSKQVTLKDLKKDFDKNGEKTVISHAVETKVSVNPMSTEEIQKYAIAKTYKDAMEAVERSYEYDYPLYVVDLLYWKG